MTTPEKTENIPVTQLKQVLKSSSEDALMRFMNSYAIGVGADVFISLMNEPNQRFNFFVAIAKTYSADWQKAAEYLKE